MTTAKQFSPHSITLHNSFNMNWSVKIEPMHLLSSCFKASNIHYVAILLILGFKVLEYISVSIIMTCALQSLAFFCANLLLTHSTSKHTEDSAVSCWQRLLQESPSFIKGWLRCLNLSVVNDSLTQRTCEGVSNAYLHVPHLGLSTRPSLVPYYSHGQRQAYILCADTKRLARLMGTLLNFYQFPSVLAPVLAVFCYDLPVSPQTPGSVRLI